MTFTVEKADGKGWRIVGGGRAAWWCQYKADATRAAEYLTANWGRLSEIQIVRDLCDSVVTEKKKGKK